MSPPRAGVAATEADRSQVQLCTFRVSGEDFAVDIMRVREIIPPAMEEHTAIAAEALIVDTRRGRK